MTKLDALKQSAAPASEAQTEALPPRIPPALTQFWADMADSSRFQEGAAPSLPAAPKTEEK